MRWPDRATLLSLVRILVLAVAITVVLALIHVPSPALFGGLLAGMVHALTSRSELAIPPVTYRAAQAVVGAIIGTQISSEALRELVTAAVPILVVTTATVAVSVGGGLLLARRGDVSPVTGVCAMIAGGAAGVVAVARDLGADDRVVTVVQYLRVAVVLLTLPVVTALVFDPDSGLGALTAADVPIDRQLVYVAATVVIGLVAARLIPVTTTIILVPMLVGAVLSTTGWIGELAVPGAVASVAYALIGVQVGLRFTRASLAAIARMLPVVLAIIVGLIVTTGAMAAALARFTDVDGLTAYLATTPGGLFAVLATAADTGSDVTYVMALQLFRLLVILAIVPFLARWLRPRAA